MILLIPLLLVIMLCVAAMNTLGPARVINVYNANELALRDATVAAEPALTANPSIDLIREAMSQVRPELPPLPNHLHEATTEKQIKATKILTGMTLTDKAIYPSPAYTLSDYPNKDDYAGVAEWYSAYAEESKLDVEGPLGLMPAYPP